VTNLGPGLNSLGLAIGLYTTIEISRRDEDQLVVETKVKARDAMNGAASPDSFSHHAAVPQTGNDDFRTHHQGQQPYSVEQRFGCG